VTAEEEGLKIVKKALEDSNEGVGECSDGTSE